MFHSIEIGHYYYREPHLLALMRPHRGGSSVPRGYSMLIAIP